MPAHYGLTQWLDNMKTALAVFGPDLLGARNHIQFLKDAGFVNVEQKILKIPIGTWPKNRTLKTIGLYGRSVVEFGLEANSLRAFTKGLGWSVDEVHVFLANGAFSSQRFNFHNLFRVLGRVSISQGHKLQLEIDTAPETQNTRRSIC